MDRRDRLARLADRLLTTLLVTTLVGTTLAFGGQVWWAPLGIGVLCLLLVAAVLLRILLSGRMPVLKSPLGALGGLAVLLAVGQVVPLPPALAGRLSPASRAAYAVGFLPDQARSLDPGVELPEAPVSRTPVSLDRPATLRWAAGASACLTVFWVASQYADRLGHLYVVWGSIVGVFCVNVALAVVQLACRARGLFGLIEPGGGPVFAPNAGDLIASPGARLLRLAGASEAGHPVWALSVPDRPFTLGTLMGGPGALLALASLGLPLALGLTLQLLAPRGSRESTATRLRHTGGAGLAALLVVMLLAGSAVVGMLAGPVYSAPFVIALLVVGVPSAWPSGLRWSALGLTAAPVAVLLCAAFATDAWSRSQGPTAPPVSPLSLNSAAKVWADALPIVREFPLLGTGLGTFATVYPFYKTQDASSTTAMSSLLQWWVESGIVGVAVLGAGLLWCLVRLPGALRNVGTADRSLAFGLIGAAFGFSLFSAVHWTVELASVALAASAVLGTCNRWLAGGTDLFVEQA